MDATVAASFASSCPFCARSCKPRRPGRQPNPSAGAINKIHFVADGNTSGIARGESARALARAPHRSGAYAPLSSSASVPLGFKNVRRPDNEHPLQSQRFAAEL